MLNKAILLCGGGNKGPTLTIDLTEVPEKYFYAGGIDFVDGSYLSFEAGNVYKFPIQSLDFHGEPGTMSFYSPCLDLSGISHGDWKEDFINIYYWGESGLGWSYYFCPADLTQDAVFKLTNFIS